MSSPDPDGLFAQGKLHYELGEYEQAIVFFRRAYEETRDPGFLFNVAQSYRLLGKCRQALQVYSHFLRLAPAHPNAVSAASNVSVLETQCPSGPSQGPSEAVPLAPGGEVSSPAAAAPARALPRDEGPPNALRPLASEARSTGTDPSASPSGPLARDARFRRRLAIAATATIGVGSGVVAFLFRQSAADHGRHADALALRLESTGLTFVDGMPAPSDAELERRRQRALTLESRADWSALALSATAGALLSAAFVLWAPWESWSVQAGPQEARVAFTF